MQRKPPNIPQKPAQTAPLANPPLAGANGSLTIGQMLPDPYSIDGRQLGKVIIQDIGARYRQMVGLKPGSSSIRTMEMIDEIIERLVMGEQLSLILMSDHLPAPRTFYNWCRQDAWLDDEFRWALAMGQRTLKDLIQNIAAGGEYSTGDPRRDELLIKAIERNASQRNRAEFGDRATVSVEHTLAPVMLPIEALPSMNGIEDDDPDDDDGED